MKIALFLLGILKLVSLEALVLRRVIRPSSVAPPCANMAAPNGLPPIISPYEDLARKLTQLGSKEKQLDWQRWTFKAVPIFLVLLAVSTFIGAGTVLPLVLSVAILMALIIHDGVKEMVQPVCDKLAGDAFKQVASDGLLGLGRGLLGLGTRLGGGFVFGMLVIAYIINKDDRISGKKVAKNGKENDRSEV